MLFRKLMVIIISIAVAAAQSQSTLCIERITRTYVNSKRSDSDVGFYYLGGEICNLHTK